MTTLVNFYLLALTPILHYAPNFTITIQEDKLAVSLFHITILNGMVVNPSNYPVSSTGTTYRRFSTQTYCHLLNQNSKNQLLNILLVLIPIS